LPYPSIGPITRPAPFPRRPGQALTLTIWADHVIA